MFVCLGAVVWGFFSFSFFMSSQEDRRFIFNFLLYFGEIYKVSIFPDNFSQLSLTVFRFVPNYLFS